MSWVGATNVYLTAHVLLIIASVSLALLLWLAPKLRIAHRHRLRIAYALLALVIVTPIAASVQTREEQAPQKVQVWSASSMRGWTEASDSRGAVSIPLGAVEFTAPLDVAALTSLSLLLIGFSAVAIRTVTEARHIHRLVHTAHGLHRLGRVRLLASEDVRVPFSFWLPGGLFIIVPVTLLLTPRDLRVTIRHEAQHHRQWDTMAVHILQMLRALLFWNPAVHWLTRRIGDLQELSCDEALVAQRKVDAGQYCGCLLRAAEQAELQPAPTFRLQMSGNSGCLLRRRVEALTTNSRLDAAPWKSLALTTMAFLVMTSAALALDAPLSDRRISIADARQMLASAQQDSHFRFVVNDAVLRELNRLSGTPDGRRFLRESLGRMQRYEPMISAALAERDLPRELLAVPLAESGYRNLALSQHPWSGDKAWMNGAGLWQFIAPTARRFGLRVDEQVDERLDPTLATEAALDMLAALHDEYEDWGLALLAYNGGNWRVDKGIAAARSRDVWQLTRSGFENDAGYVPRVYALMLVLKNPGLVTE